MEKILEQLKKQDTQPEIQQFIQSKLATSYT